MQLPPPLRAAVDQAVAGLVREELNRAADRLSLRYRAEIQDGAAHIHDEASALAYAVARLPATFAAIRRALAEAAARSDASPATMLDAGAGPGTSLWAAVETWPSLAEAVMIEQSPSALALGQRLSTGLASVSTAWIGVDVTRGFDEFGPRDLVTLCYVLNEIEPGKRQALVDRLWQLAREILVIVEPGTPAGWRRILAAREQLMAAGAHILAPCPHRLACPLDPPDWCHFACRVARSRAHREAKSAVVPWEDEKFIYLAAARRPAAPFVARVIARPKGASGRVTLKLCCENGRCVHRLVSRRDRDAYRRARRLDWGDALPRA
ncbi:MAG: small ribosomal subunit Rsm22 family protein [Hyphomicrobiales bacterium]